MMTSKTYKLCLKLLERSKLTADMLDVFFAAKRLTDDEYTKLITMIKEG